MALVSDKFTDARVAIDPRISRQQPAPLSEDDRRALLDAVGRNPEIDAMGNAHVQRVTEIDPDTRFTPEAKQ